MTVGAFTLAGTINQLQASLSDRPLPHLLPFLGLHPSLLPFNSIQTQQTGLEGLGAASST